ncbi:protease [Paenibacillus alkalitolerans]|uniref:protease n=1 Tax=Paenibacillus alkalitolerans TaxID=2799335 RepID=UPI0018F5AA18|nr:protease [Paenibacillus alkalitolerans]
MIELYWFCFIAGSVFALLLVFADFLTGGWVDGLTDILPDFLHPIAIVGGVVAFGGAGILLSAYSPFGIWLVLALSLLLASFLSITLFFFYVKPMKEAENSIAYSITELPGKIGVVTIPIPVNGFGEVSFTFGHGLVHEIASSTEQEELRSGEKVLAIEVKDHVVTVCRWTETGSI